MGLRGSFEAAKKKPRHQSGPKSQCTYYDVAWIYKSVASGRVSHWMASIKSLQIHSLTLLHLTYSAAIFSQLFIITYIRYNFFLIINSVNMVFRDFIMWIVPG